MSRADAGIILAFAGFVLIGGSNVVAVRFSNAELDPFWGAGARFAAASLLFFILVLLRRARLPRGRALAGAALYGLFNFAAFYACAYWALLHIGSGPAAVVLGLTPLVTFGLAVAQRQEAFRWRAVAGGLLAVAGLAVVFEDGFGGEISGWAVLALVGAAAASGQASLVVKRFPPVDPAAMNAVGMLVGSALLLALSLVAGEEWTAPTRTSTWLVLVYLVTLGGLALFLLVLYVLRHWTASATAYGFVLFPIVATSLGAWLADEQVTGRFILGSLLVLLGVYVGALARRSPLVSPPLPAGSDGKA
ncbi:MAG: EamA family transporter [Candidatus Thermoplasmatota archaeon]|jgi:drug/metabolite transporter (DMT)-like permease